MMTCQFYMGNKQDVSSVKRHVCFVDPFIHHTSPNTDFVALGATSPDFLLQPLEVT